MIRLSLILIAAAAVVQPATLSAQALGHYVATPADPAKVAKIKTRGTDWFPRDGRLLAVRAPETPAKLCQMVAKKVGPLAGFTVGGRAFGADALAACNGATSGTTAIAAK